MHQQPVVLPTVNCAIQTKDFASHPKNPPSAGPKQQPPQPTPPSRLWTHKLSRLVRSLSPAFRSLSLSLSLFVSIALAAYQRWSILLSCLWPLAQRAKSAERVLVRRRVRLIKHTHTHARTKLYHAFTYDMCCMCTRSAEPPPNRSVCACVCVCARLLQLEMARKCSGKTMVGQSSRWMPGAHCLAGIGITIGLRTCANTTKHL